MAALSRLDLGPNLRTWLGPGFFSNLLTNRGGSRRRGPECRRNPAPHFKNTAGIADV
jgi:hypothetical protein